jgi:hypothetical protein
VETTISAPWPVGGAASQSTFPPTRSLCHSVFAEQLFEPASRHQHLVLV